MDLRKVNTFYLYFNNHSCIFRHCRTIFLNLKGEEHMITPISHSNSMSVHNISNCYDHSSRMNFYTSDHSRKQYKPLQKICVSYSEQVKTSKSVCRVAIKTMDHLTHIFNGMSIFVPENILGKELDRLECFVTSKA